VLTVGGFPRLVVNPKQLGNRIKPVSECYISGYIIKSHPENSTEFEHIIAAVVRRLIAWRKRDTVLDVFQQAIWPLEAA